MRVDVPHGYEAHPLLLLTSASSSPFCSWPSSLISGGFEAYEGSPAHLQEKMKTFKFGIFFKDLASLKGGGPADQWQEVQMHLPSPKGNFAFVFF